LTLVKCLGLGQLHPVYHRHLTYREDLQNKTIAPVCT